MRPISGRMASSTVEEASFSLWMMTCLVLFSVWFSRFVFNSVVLLFTSSGRGTPKTGLNRTTKQNRLFRFLRVPSKFQEKQSWDFFVDFLFVFKDRASLCKSGCSGTH